MTTLKTKKKISVSIVDLHVVWNCPVFLLSEAYLPLEVFVGKVAPQKDLVVC